MKPADKFAVFLMVFMLGMVTGAGTIIAEQLTLDQAYGKDLSTCQDVQQ